MLSRPVLFKNGPQQVKMLMPECETLGCYLHAESLASQGETIIELNNSVLSDVVGLHMGASY